MSAKYNIQEVEKKWQEYWAKTHSFQVGCHNKRSPFYVLEMFPYPSGTLHMGHARNYTIGDTLARYRWAQGYEVLHPMGWDACGLPAENAALKHKVHPKEWTYHNASVMKQQCQSLGFSHDWSRELFSCDPGYFKHEQKMFLDFYEKGLAYRKEAYVNWDPVENSVLANEQVIDGRGWRSGAVVEKRLRTQWFFKITSFAPELLGDLKGLDHWPEAVKQMQVNWIGWSSGYEITFTVESGDQFDIFTTRGETLYGASFCALAPDHPLVQKWGLDNKELASFCEECRHKGTSERIIETEEKKGVFTGHYATHPLQPDVRLPIFAANYVLSEYGTGAIFGCPAHDQRDFDLARAHNLPILYVIQPSQDQALDTTKAYTGDGVMVNSYDLDGLDLIEARQKIGDQLIAKGIAVQKSIYRLRDWGIGRQRYWGVPIPMIHCPSCGVVPVPSDQLPVVLPEDVTFDKPGNPLDHHPTWKYTKCPSCGGAAERETDTFDTFVESSWYFGRFCDPHNTEKAFSREKAEKWLPVKQYVGGIEHAVLHLLYARFFTKALKMCGYWTVEEPFEGLFTQGMVCHKTYQRSDTKEWIYPQDVSWDEDKPVCGDVPVIVGRSEKMSKSKCNVVGVTPMVEAYGADAVRLFLLSDTPPARDMEWTEEGIEGAWRYVRRLWTLINEKVTLCHNKKDEMPVTLSPQAESLWRLVHSTIQKVTDALEAYELNKYIAHLRELSNAIGDFCPANPEDKKILWESLRALVQMVAPVTPHIAEEVGSLLGFSPGLHLQGWPQADPSFLVQDTVKISVQVNGKFRGHLNILVDTCEEEIFQRIKQDPTLQKHVAQGWKKAIVVPGRVVNLIV